MPKTLYCHNCQKPVALVEDNSETSALCFSCSSPKAVAERDRLAVPGRPLPGVEQYDSVPKKGPPREVLECPHPRATARFQCMRCLGRSRLCGPCSMDGACMHCAKTQPKTVDAFVAGIEEGLSGTRMSDPDMAKEARELDDFFGDDMRIKIR